jgi:gluconate 2-dehydrogenase gamma chain
MSDWRVNASRVEPSSNERLFFTDHEWNTVEATAARIIPTDRDPGAREARVVLYIDRFLSGITYIYASADGSGFLELTGRRADAWRARVGELQTLYRAGVRELDEISILRKGKRFIDLSEDVQDNILADVAGPPPSGPANLEGWTSSEARGSGVGFFFHTLVSHTRQGFYSDPVYGGNFKHSGWKTIGFPGPSSPKDTVDGTYSIREYYVHDYDWEDLIPHLRKKQKNSRSTA